jgi:hypothetical protein
MKLMEVVGVVFIATNHFLVVAFFLVIADGPPPDPDGPPLCINSYKCIKCVVRC